MSPKSGIDSSESILAEYDSSQPLYVDLAGRTEQLIRELLRARQIRVHAITSRPKTRDSLRDKLQRSQHAYAKLNEITDLAGVRVIAYFYDDVDKIAKMIEQEFEVDQANSVDKRKTLEPDRFGYVSVHYVVSLSASRRALPEYAHLASGKLEIQIRSVLQHAWAEIEHDLGYKTEKAVPAPIRRSFCRLAGLLEIADGEFVNIRTNLRHYERAVVKQIRDEPSTVMLDKASLSAYVSDSLVLAKADGDLALAVGAVMRFSEQYIDILLKNLTSAGFDTIASVDNALQAAGKRLTAFQLALFPKGRWSNLSDTDKGVSLYHLCLYVAAPKGEEAISSYLKSIGLSEALSFPVESFSKQVAEAYTSVQKTEVS
jgi:putative GTP pyrophosphokinase